jgi:hypothetical protein
MKMTRYLISVFTLGTLVLSGCGGIESKSHPAYAPMEPIVYTMPAEGVTPASLYSEQRGSIALCRYPRPVCGGHHHRDADGVDTGVKEC